MHIYEGFDYGPLFLLFEILVKVVIQGGFANYKPEPLNEILSEARDTEFAVELIAAVYNERELGCNNYMNLCDT